MDLQTAFVCYKNNKIRIPEKRNTDFSKPIKNY